MSKRLFIAAAGSALLAICLVSPLAVGANGPSAQQVRSAVARAEHSRHLWATINICNSRRHRHQVGIRGQMPALGFPSWLYMRVQVQYYSSAHRRFTADPGVARWLSLGRFGAGYHQAGVTFALRGPALLRGVILFRWSRNGHVVGQTLRVTGGGYRQVDYGDPPGYSAARCSIPRR